MARVRTPNQKKAYNALNNRLTQYVSQVQSIYDMANRRMAEIAASTGYDGEVPFSFKDYPELAEAVKDVQAQFVNEIGTTIMRGTSDEWRQSNLMQDLLADKVLKHYRAQVRGKRFKQYYQTNSEALRAFQTRRERGLNLSDKLWMQSDLYRKEMEVAISTAIEKGMSAITLSKRISRYLSDYPSLKHDYWEKYAKAADCHDCEYRSIRLARTEINMAYRTAEQERWKQFDFVLGYEIKLSGNHPAVDICNYLIGRYPKDFKFVGWHPNCMCYVVPIIMSEEEYWSENRRKSDEQITDVPDRFKEWIMDNRERIDVMKERRTLPYFIKDNSKYMKVDVWESARLRHASRTAEDIERIQRAWDNHNVIIETGEQWSLKSLRKNAKKYGVDITEFEDWIATSRLTIDKNYDIPGYEERIKAANDKVVKRAEEYEKKVSVIRQIRSKAMAYSEVGGNVVAELDSMLSASPIDVFAIKQAALNKVKRAVNGMKDKWEVLMYDRGKKTIDNAVSAYEKNLSANSAEDILTYTGKAKGFKIQGIERDCDVYLTRGGIKVYVPEDLDGSAQHFTPHQMAEAIEQLPKKLQASIKEVHLADFENPQDPFWRQTYKGFTRSFATGGDGVVTFYKNTAAEATTDGSEIVTAKNTFYHETGHNIDRMMHTVSGRSKWQKAMSADQKKSNLASPTTYGENSASEDFAESMEWYYRDRKWFEKMFPNRYKIIQDIMK